MRQRTDEGRRTADCSITCGIAIRPCYPTEGIRIMLLTIAIILIALWALGLVSGTTVGGFVHLLLVIAVIVVLVQFISGRRSL